MRQATPDDIPRLVAWGRLFHAESQQPSGLDGAALSAFLAGLIASETAVILVTDHGMIGGALVPAYCDPKWKIAIELFWWAERGGMGLLRGFEDWAVRSGASEIRMTSLETLPRADRLLRAKGYAPAEISYRKVT